MTGFILPGVVVEGSVPRLDELRAHVDGIASVALDGEEGDDARTRTAASAAGRSVRFTLSESPHTATVTNRQVHPRHYMRM
jgi:hypothetical protein